MVAQAQLRPNGGAVSGAYSIFHRRVATILARSRARHITFFQAHATRPAVLVPDNEVAAAFPDFDDDDIIEIDEDVGGPNLLNGPLVI